MPQTVHAEIQKKNPKTTKEVIYLLLLGVIVVIYNWEGQLL